MRHACVKFVLSSVTEDLDGHAASISFLCVRTKRAHIHTS